MLEDYRNSDYRLLSLKTGVPIDHIDNALKAYEMLFPTPGGWFKKEDDKSRITFLKMMPAPWIGIGAHYQRMTYGANQDIKQLKLNGMYTSNDLARNINALVELLKD